MTGWLSPGTTKACIALSLACGTMLFASIPVILSRRSYNHRSGVRHILTGLSCLGGGVFLATCFLHLLPEAVQAMDAAIAANKIVVGHFPLSHAIVVAGFLLVLICEQFIHIFNKDEFEHGHGHSHGPPLEAVPPVPVPNYGAIVRNTALDPVDATCELALAENNEGQTLEETTEDSDDDDDRITTVSMHGDPGSHTAFRAIVLVFALSLHSIFEGIAIGLQKSIQEVVQLFGVIVVHKSVIAITLATSLVSSSTRLGYCAVFTALVIFSSMAPLGIIIALLLKNSSPLVDGVLQCIAAGTFVYITFFEILPHELNSKNTEGSRLFKLMMLLLGIGLIVALIIAFPDHDDDAPHPGNNTTRSSSDLFLST